MLPADLALQAKLLASAKPDIGTLERISGTTPTAAVQPVAATVAEQLADGRFKVLVEGQSLLMKLPPEVKPGQQVKLVYVGPTGDQRYALLHDPEQATQTTVSSTGRLLAALAAQSSVPTSGKPVAEVSATLAEGARSARETLAGSAPVFESLPLPQAEIAPRLRQTLAESGLFYEAHQAQWLDGHKTLESLLREPQGQLSPRLPQNVDGGGTKPAASVGTTTVRVDSSPAPLQDAPQTPAANRGANADMPAHPATQPIIQQQLATLETGQVLWHGQIWPGQTMDWSVAESPDDKPGAGGDGSAAWETTLSLDMTLLGEVTARLSIRGGRIAIRLAAGDQDVRQLFDLRSGELVRAMNDAGLQVGELRISPDEQA